MKPVSLSAELSGNTYPGRGILLGLSENGRYAAAAYFIMGRSENSRNRVFVADGNGLRTQAFDPSKVKDPTLIIYSPVRVLGNKTIITNGDQTDTIYELMDKQMTFEQALRTRTFEPDAPNYTARISGILHVEPENKENPYNFALSILKSDNGDPSSTLRQTFAYTSPKAGFGRLIHTYTGDGDPLPSFEGEPTLVQTIPDDIDALTDLIWNSLNPDNKISLFTRYICLEDGSFVSRIVNKNK